jgi:hypothetical protein
MKSQPMLHSYPLEVWEAERNRREQKKEENRIFIQADYKRRIHKTLIDGIKDKDALERFLLYAIQMDGTDGTRSGVRIPKVGICEGHVSPFDYLSDSFLYPGRWDKVCWANRGGGKTFLGAISTWLDSIIMAGCETKILGGSLEQSAKMYAYTAEFWGDEDNYFRERYLAAEPTARRTQLKNNSSFHILTASSKSVRGPHVQRLKLDEIDEFDREIYEAACYIPLSKRGIRACTEIFSTMHRPYGLMSEIIDSYSEQGYKLYKWCVFEVLKQCREPLDACQRCLLFEDCVTELYPEGKARKSDGYIPLEDAINEKQKVSYDSWQAEALCKRAKRSGLVFRDYWDDDIHIVDNFIVPSGWKKYRALDFGVENPFCCLYIAQSPEDEFFVYDEIYQTGKTSGEWAEIIYKMEMSPRQDMVEGLEFFEFTTADPSALDQRMTFNNHSVPTIPCWNNDIEFGIELVKRLLKIHPVRKAPSLKVLKRCVNTIREFNMYHYRENKTGDRNLDEKPVDSHNHALDAFRYFAADISRRGIDVLETER